LAGCGPLQHTGSLAGLLERVGRVGRWLSGGWMAGLGCCRGQWCAFRHVLQANV